MITTHYIKRHAWLRVTKHFKTVFLISLIPMIFTVFGVTINHQTTIIDTRSYQNHVNIEGTLPNGANYNISSNELVHFLNDNWFVILIIGLLVLFITLLIGIILTAISDFFTESAISGLIDWRDDDRLPHDPIRAGLQLLTGVAFRIVLLRALYITLWSFLLIVPGIIKSFSYSQALYLYRDDLRAGRPIKSANAYIKSSQSLIYGYKGQLFVMYISLIGWYILNLITFGIANLFTLPYILVLRSEFYIALRATAPEPIKTTIL